MCYDAKHMFAQLPGYRRLRYIAVPKEDIPEASKPDGRVLRPTRLRRDDKPMYRTQVTAATGLSVALSGATACYMGRKWRFHISSGSI